MTQQIDPVTLVQAHERAAFAAGLLTGLWNPPRKVDGILDDEEDGCTGEGWCDCSLCAHQRYVLTARCSLKECNEPITLRLRAWRPDSGGRRISAGDLGRTENPDEQISFGDQQVQMMGSERYACGLPHAHALWQQLVDRYNTPDQPDRWRIEIENWRYEPDWFDLPRPGGVFWLREAVRSLDYQVRSIVDAVNPHAAAPTRHAGSALADARRSAARLVTLLAALDARDIPQARYVDAIPADVDTVHTARTGQQPHYFNRRWPTSPTSGWFCTTLGQGYDTDEALLAAYPDGLYERPRSELVLPGIDETDCP